MTYYKQSCAHHFDLCPFRLPRRRRRKTHKDMPGKRFLKKENINTILWCGKGPFGAFWSNEFWANACHRKEESHKGLLFFYWGYIGGGWPRGRKNHSDPLPILWHTTYRELGWKGRESSLHPHAHPGLTSEFGDRINPNLPSSLYGQFDDTNLLLLLLCELGRSQITPPRPPARSYPRFPSAKKREIRRKITHCLIFRTHAAFQDTVFSKIKNTISPTNTIYLAISGASDSSPRHTKASPNEQKKPPLFPFSFFVWLNLPPLLVFRGVWVQTHFYYYGTWQVPKEIRGSTVFFVKPPLAKERPARRKVTN